MLTKRRRWTLKHQRGLGHIDGLNDDTMRPAIARLHAAYHATGHDLRIIQRLDTGATQAPVAVTSVSASACDIS